MKWRNKKMNSEKENFACSVVVRISFSDGQGLRSQWEEDLMNAVGKEKKKEKRVCRRKKDYDEQLTERGKRESVNQERKKEVNEGL